MTVKKEWSGWRQKVRTDLDRIDKRVKPVSDEHQRKHLLRLSTADDFSSRPETEQQKILSELARLSK